MSKQISVIGWVPIEETEDRTLEICDLANDIQTNIHNKIHDGLLGTTLDECRGWGMERGELKRVRVIVKFSVEKLS